MPRDSEGKSKNEEIPLRIWSYNVIINTTSISYHYRTIVEGELILGKELEKLKKN